MPSEGIELPSKHDLLKSGENWDAFWDAIIAVVEMPDCVVLQHWERFAQACPRDVLILRDIIANYPQENPGRRLLLGA